MLDHLLIASFVDARVLPLLPCHRMSHRSFTVRGRQFNVCARCTGLLAGILASPLLTPWRHVSLLLFLSGVAMVALDGITQLIGVRESNNLIRVITGFVAGLWVVPIALRLVGI